MWFKDSRVVVLCIYEGTEVWSLFVPVDVPVKFSREGLHGFGSWTVGNEFGEKLPLLEHNTFKFDSPGIYYGEHRDIMGEVSKKPVLVIKAMSKWPFLNWLLAMRKGPFK